MTRGHIFNGIASKYTYKGAHDGNRVMVDVLVRQQNIGEPRFFGAQVEIQ